MQCIVHDLGCRQYPKSQCPKLTTGGAPHTHHFLKPRKDEQWTCFSCGSINTYIPFNAIKVVEYMSGMETLTVYDRRTHTYSLKPSVAQNNNLMKEAIQLAKELSDKPRMKQVKQGIVSFQNPETQPFEVVGKDKTTADKYEKYFTYSINSTKLNNKPS